MTRRFEDLDSLPLRDHGSRLRVDAGWRRLERRLSTTSEPRREPLLRAAALVLVFGGGVFVGSRWSRPAAAPSLSAEQPVVLEPAAGPARPGIQRPEAPKPAPTARQPLRSRAPVLASSPVALAAPAPTVVDAPAPVSAPPAWERLAEAGDFEAARTALEAQGGFEAAIEVASAPELMTLVDIARASGSRERAVLALRRVVGGFPNAPEAPDAAWTLGNLLEQAGDQAGAAEAFSLYRRLSPSGDFAQDALAHEVDAAFARGDLELSARLVAQYEHEFPNGPRLTELRAELERRTLKAAGATSSSPDDSELPADDADPSVDETSAPAHEEPRE